MWHPRRWSAATLRLHCILIYIDHFMRFVCSPDQCSHTVLPESALSDDCRWCMLSVRASAWPKACGLMRSLTVSDFRVDLGRLRALSASVIAQVQCTTAALSCFFGTGRAKQKHMWPLATREPFTHAVRVRTTPVRQKEATLLCRSGIVRNLPAPVPPSCGVSTPGCVDCAGLRCPAKLNRPSGVWLAPAMAARAGIMRVNGIGGWH